MILDLQAMLVCDASLCGDHPPWRIVRATADRIVLEEQPGLSIFIRRRDWRYRERQEDFIRVDVTTGQCVPGRFSGFPARPRHEAAGTPH
jgi:hypothetical protein